MLVYPIRFTDPDGRAPDDIILKGKNLDAIYFEDGRAILDGGAFKYQYCLKDNLGNTRVMFEDDGNGVASLVQENHYYSFGLAQNGEWSQPNVSDYTFGGKELNEDFSLNLIDFGNRWQDPATGRFTTIDRFAGKYASMTPFHYGANNPVKFIDINGDSIIVSEAMQMSATYDAFLEWQNSEQGKEFSNLYGEGGKFENIAVVFDVGYNVEASTRGTTQPLAVNDETGKETELVAEETIIRYGLKNKKSSLEKGERLKFIVELDALLSKDAKDKRNLVNKASTILHETQHVEMVTRDISADRKLNIGGYNQHVIMKRKSGKWFKARYNFYKKRRPDLTNDIIKTAVNGFDL